MKARRTIRICLAIAAFALVASACGKDDDGGDDASGSGGTERGRAHLRHQGGVRLPAPRSRWPTPRRSRSA